VTLVRIIALYLALLTASRAAPAVNKVEPPNWWVHHTLSPVQLLLTGADLAGATVVAPKGFRAEVRQSSTDGRYLFAYVTIPTSAKPGAYQFQVRKGSSTTEFNFALDAPLAPAGRFQGFTPDDVIYLLMPDRFATESSAAVNSYHGGNLRGIRDHLAYLKDLGVTGIWATPVYKNSTPDASPYHGYHTVDFYDVEPHFGTMKDFRDLVDAAHQLGLKVVQDQVANHCGPRHPWVAAPPTPTWFHDLARRPRLRNNFDIAALADPYARPGLLDPPLRGWFAGNLPDLDQSDPLVSDYLIQNTLWWIGMSGIDAIRQDTYPYVDRPFWEKWQAAIDRQYPNLTVTGEITARTPAVLSFFDGGTRRRGVDTHLKSMLDFPLENAIRAVFARGEPMTQLTDILAQDFLYQRPEMLVAFIGNHDQPRFLTEAGGDIGRLQMAQAFLLTTRRVPHLYYGDEIAMGAGTDRTDRTIRADFSPAAFLSAPTSPTFTWLRELLHFRQEHPALRRGTLTQLLVNKDQYAFLRTSPEERVLVVLNRAGDAGPIELNFDDVKVHLTLPHPDPITIRAKKGTDAF
jgi:glycosidase